MLEVTSALGVVMFVKFRSGFTASPVLLDSALLVLATGAVTSRVSPGDIVTP